MPDCPRFKPHLRVEVVEGEGAFVLSGTGQTLLRGRLYEQVLPWVGEGRTADDICDLLEGRVSAAEVYYVLAQLEQKGYLRGEEGVQDDESAWWWSRGVDPRDATARLASSPVVIHSLGVDPRPLRSLLEAMRVSLADPDGDGRIVALVDDYRRPGLAEINKEALERGRPWLLVRPVGRQVWVGPLFRPGVTGCWECLADRLRANSPVDTYLDSLGGHAGRPRAVFRPFDAAATAASLSVAWGLAAEAITRWIVQGELPEVEGKVQTLDLANWKIESHTMVRLPCCPACGDRPAKPTSDPRPLRIASHPIARAGDAGYRTTSPEETIRKYGHHVSPITGAVTMLERIGPDAGAAQDGATHVYIAGHNLARRHRSLAHLRGDLRNRSSGKGTTDAQARASGLCEGLERYSGVFRGDEPRRRATQQRLGSDAIPPAVCLLFSERQYRERDTWNARKSHYHFVPIPLDPDAEIDWTPAWSLSRGEPRYLATAFCYYNVPQPGSEPFCLGDSNGCAAGNTIEEAILQGFFELVERDAVALWWYNRARRPEVDLASFDDPYLHRIRADLAARGRDIWVLDLTTDLEIPVFAALSRETDGGEQRIMPGFGAHTDARVALLRAVTEMNQMLANLPERGAPPGAGAVDDAETLEWLQTATVDNQPYLLPDAGSPPATARSFVGRTTNDLAEDIQMCRALVESRGMELIVLDQTRPEIGLPVVKVVVPGLRHFWARFAPGRLYDVPVRLGWQTRATTEGELNPIPMFL